MQVRFGNHCNDEHRTLIVLIISAKILSIFSASSNKFHTEKIVFTWSEMLAGTRSSGGYELHILNSLLTFEIRRTDLKLKRSRSMSVRNQLLLWPLLEIGKVHSISLISKQDSIMFHFLLHVTTFVKTNRFAFQSF